MNVQLRRYAGLTEIQSAFYGKPKPDEERFAVLDKVYNDGELFWDR